MVDEFRIWAPGGPRCFRKGSSHLTCDDVEALHSFAIKIGLKPEWFQPHRVHPHYDLTEQRRKAALENGAVFVPAKQQAWRRLLSRLPESPPTPPTAGDD